MAVAEEFERWVGDRSMAEIAQRALAMEAWNGAVDAVAMRLLRDCGEILDDEREKRVLEAVIRSVACD